MKYVTFSSNKVGKGCQHDKTHKQYFDRSFSRRKFFLKFIHNNIIGLFQTSSYLGSCYIFHFIDDVTRLTYVDFVNKKIKSFF